MGTQWTSCLTFPPIYSGPHHFREGSFLIATLSKPRLQGSELRLQQHFRWVTLRWDQEPLHGLLGRHLRRKLLHKVSEWMFTAALISLLPNSDMQKSHLDMCQWLISYIVIIFFFSVIYIFHGVKNCSKDCNSKTLCFSVYSAVSECCDWKRAIKWIINGWRNPQNYKICFVVKHCFNWFSCQENQRWTSFFSSFSLQSKMFKL